MLGVVGWYRMLLLVLAAQHQCPKTQPSSYTSTVTSKKPRDWRVAGTSSGPLPRKRPLKRARMRIVGEQSSYCCCLCPACQQSEKGKARFSAAEVHNSFNCPSAIPLKGSTQHCWRGNPSNLVEWKPLLIIFLLSWWTLFHSRIETLWTCMGSRSQLSSTLREPGQSCKELLVPLCPLLSFRRPQIPSLGGNLCRINKSFTSLLFASMWIWLSSLDKNVLKQLWTLLSSCRYD